MMHSKDILRSETAHYHALAAQLKTSYADIDDETLADTLEGLSDLPQMIEEIVRSSLDDDALVTGLKARIGDMNARLDRIQERMKRKRELACWAMGTAGIHNLAVEDFSVALRHGLPRLEVTDPAKLPENYLVPQPPRVDKLALMADLKRGEVVVGANLLDGLPHIAVRTK